MQFKVLLKDVETGKTFYKYIKNDYFLNKFKIKVKYSKKIMILHIEDLYR